MMKNKGQTILEYTILIGIATVALFYMGPGIKRGIQSMIKVTADQVGVQNQADQRVEVATPRSVGGTPQDPGQRDDSARAGGYLVGSYSSTKTKSNRAIEERLYATNIIFNEETVFSSNSETNQGFTETR